MEVGERIRSRGSDLTSAERRVAEAVLAAPQAVAFGTVADLAKAAGVGAASVVRLATKLGFEGYSDLQQCIQRDLTRQLRPAAERIQEDGGAPSDDHAASEVANVRATLAGVQRADLRAAVDRLADLSRPVVVLSGEATMGVTTQFATDLGQLRAGVSILAGSDVAIRRHIALVPCGATVVAVDLRRYERWVLDARDQLHGRDVWTVALTDSLLSPIAARAKATFVLSAGAIGPFDSHVGTLALLNLLVGEVAGTLRSTATERLAGIEAAWSEHGSLTDRS